MRSDGSRPTRLTRLAGPLLAIVAFTVLFGAAPPSAIAPGAIHQLADAPAQGNGGVGGLDPLVLVLIVVLAVAAVALLGAAFVLFRTRGAKAVPPMSEGWWTCAKCGAGNMDGAARCHNCATWRSSAPQPRASPTP
jgi:hypothetical protein